MEELDLKELFGIFWARKAQIVLLILIFLVIGFMYSFILLIPEYQSITQILLAKSNTTTRWWQYYNPRNDHITNYIKPTIGFYI